MAAPSGGYLSPGHAGPCDGLEVDQRATGLQVAPLAQEIEATPAELQSGYAPQMIPGPEKEAFTIEEREASLQRDDYSNLKSSSRTPLFSNRKKSWLLLATVVGVIVIVAVAVPLAVRQNRHTQSIVNSPPPINSVSTANSTANSNANLSTSGAFNGTGMAIFGILTGGIPEYHFFYQDYKSQLRQLESKQDLPFIDPGFPIVASNARNATPLAVVNYTTADTADVTSHLFYIDSTHNLQELVSTNNATTWSVGPLSAQSIPASPSAKALTAFYSSKYLGNSSSNTAGLRLYYGGQDNYIHELAYAMSAPSWSAQTVFKDTNGAGGLASSWSDSNGRANLYVLNTANEMKIWTAGMTFPPTFTTLWSEGADPAPFLAIANSSLSCTALASPAQPPGNLCFQAPSRALQCAYLGSPNGSDWGPAGMTINATTPQDAQVGSAVLAGFFSDLVDGGYNGELRVLYQTDGKNIVRGTDANAVWGNDSLPVG